ncbi:MAG: hypothetical protein LDL39_08505 [Magnetospirillum sp.]|nr:hypothetical protein [Magnetospirillum sp.]
MQDLGSRLIDTHCDQVKDAAHSGRLPLVLTLTWSLMWLWAIYSNNYTLEDGLRQRTIYFLTGLDLAIASVEPPSQQQGTPLPVVNKDVAEKVSSFVNACHEIIYRPYEGSNANFASIAKQIDSLVKAVNSLGGGVKKEDLKEGERILLSGFMKNCRAVINGRLVNEEKSVYENRKINLPGGFGRLFVMDFGIIGGISFIVILMWQFMSLRRTELSVRSFFEPGSLNFSDKNGLLLRPFTSRYLPSHMVYGFQAISERFFLISSASDRRLTVTAVFLLTFPLVPAVWDAVDALGYIKAGGWESRLYYALVLQFLILGLIGVLVGFNIASIWRTQYLVQAWQLACRHVWGKQMEREAEASQPARRVRVDVRSHRAEVVLRADDAGCKGEG